MSELPRDSILLLTTADTDILTLKHAVKQLPKEFPPVQVRNLLALSQQDTPNWNLDAELAQAKVVVVRVLGR